LQAWHDEIPGLPFQPEEEDTLESIITYGANFREYVAKYINPVMSSPEELTTQRFYLRKLEGADILLADEINFFRKELHKWAPIAPDPPPMIKVSLSTRKPRPTKQQKLMQQLGISNPDELPQHLRTKSHTFKRKSLDPTKTPQQIQPAPAEPSHTPPGLPRSFVEPQQGFFESAPSGSYNNSPIFASGAPFNLSGSSSNPPLDPAMFESTGAGPTSPLHPFASSGSGHGGESMFAELTEMGPSQADEALAVTEERDIGHEFIE
jgi:histone demethylase JARID1